MKAHYFDIILLKLFIPMMIIMMIIMIMLFMKLYVLNAVAIIVEGVPL